ncbi:MAG: DUF4190 domain-containing protein [Burkholderiaceae bacterium]|nr:DUF4190 domain-containing protein [Microbacteriaceae bacterium]
MTDQQPYAPMSAYQAVPPRGLSIASMVIGIVSFFASFTLVVPVVGLILGVMGLRREPAGRGFALAGIWINAVLLLMGALLLILVLGLLAAGLFTIPYIAGTGVSSSALG